MPNSTPAAIAAAVLKSSTRQSGRRSSRIGSPSGVYTVFDWSSARKDSTSQPAVIWFDWPPGDTSVTVAIHVVSCAVVEPFSVSDSGPDRCSGDVSGAVV